MQNLYYLGAVLLIDLIGIGVGLLIWYLNTRKYDRKPKENLPEVIVVGEGPAIHDQAQFLCDCMPKHKFKPVDDILTPVTVPGFNHLEDIAVPKLHRTMSIKQIKLKKPVKTSGPSKRRSRAQCKRSCRP